MSKGLEAYKLFLEDVEQCIQSGGIHYIDRKNRDIIEKELKALETIKKHFKFRCLGISPHRDPSLDTCYVVTENIKEVPIEKWKLLKEVLEDD